MTLWLLAVALAGAPASPASPLAQQLASQQPAAPAQAPPAPRPAATVVTAAPDEEQIVRILLKGNEPGTLFYAERSGQAAVPFVDPGIGVLRAELRGPPSRFLPLRIVASSPKGRWIVYDGTLVLADVQLETVAFAYTREQGARRIPVAPSARVDLALDPRTNLWVAYGWAGLALAYFAVMAIAAAVRSRR